MDSLGRYVVFSGLSSLLFFIVKVLFVFTEPASFFNTDSHASHKWTFVKPAAENLGGHFCDLIADDAVDKLSRNAGDYRDHYIVDTLTAQFQAVPPQTQPDSRLVGDTSG